MYTFGLLISIWKIPTHYIIYNEYPTAWYNIAHDIDHIQNLFTLDEKALCQVFIALLLYRYVMFRSTNFKRFFTAEKCTRTAPKMVCVSLAIWFYIYSVLFFSTTKRSWGWSGLGLGILRAPKSSVGGTAAFAVCLLALLGVSEWTPVCSVCFCQGRDPKGAFNYLCSQQSSHAEVCTLAKASRLGTFLKIDCHKEDIFRNTMLHIICSIWNNRFKVRLINTYLVLWFGIVVHAY